MGCGQSARIESEDPIPENYALLSLSSADVNRLQGIFRKLDINKKGYIDLSIIHAHFKIEDNPYMFHIFHQVRRHSATGDAESSLINTDFCVADLAKWYRN